MASDSSGNIIFVTSGTTGCKMWMVNSVGILTTLAGGSFGTCSYFGDGGDATSAQLYNPTSITLDSSDDIYVVDQYRIRKITASTNIISTVAGTGTISESYSTISTSRNGGLATSSEVYPRDISVNSQGNIYFAEDFLGIRVVTSNGCNGGYFSSTGAAIVQSDGSSSCSECSPGKYSRDLAVTCSRCVPGFYASKASGSCSRCGDHAFYSAGIYSHGYCLSYECTECYTCGEFEAFVSPVDGCKVCPYPSRRGRIEQKMGMTGEDYPFKYCDFYSWDAPESLSLSIVLIGSAMYLVGVLYLRDKDGNFDLHASSGLFVYTVIPALDTITDLQYVLTATFASKEIFIAIMTFYFVPMMFFFYHLYKTEVLMPGALLSLLNAALDAFNIPSTSNDYSRVIKATSFILGIPLFIVLSPFIIPWVVFGLFLYMTKLFANKRIQNFWISVWTGMPPADSDEKVDIKVLNESIYSEIVFESLPELVLQSLNNQHMGDWSLIGYMSVSLSALSVANGVYRVLYFKLYKGIDLVKVEVDLYLISGRNENLEKDGHEEHEECEKHEGHEEREECEEHEQLEEHGKSEIYKDHEEHKKRYDVVTKDDIVKEVQDLIEELKEKETSKRKLIAKMRRLLARTWKMHDMVAEEEAENVSMTNAADEAEDKTGKADDMFSVFGLIQAMMGTH